MSLCTLEKSFVSVCFMNKISLTSPGTEVPSLGGPRRDMEREMDLPLSCYLQGIKKKNIARGTWVRELYIT